jgi:hypothetical protein
MRKPGLCIAVIFLIVLAGLLVTILLRELLSKDKTSRVDFCSEWGNSAELYIGFTPDSLYRIEFDTIVSVIDTRSGRTINVFHVFCTTYPEYPFLRQMEIDPSGKYIAFLDNLNIVRVYNIFTGECEGVNDYYFDGSHHIYFSDDSKYFLMVDYREATIDILRCPGLEFIADANMGFYRSYFYWENKNGRLVFYYEVGDSLYKTVFPDDGHGDSLLFSEPGLVLRTANNNPKLKIGYK